MRTDNMYPSTHDCAKIAGAGEDLTLRCMENARKRVQVGHTRDAYAREARWSKNRYVEVCAVGAVLAEDGFRQGWPRPEKEGLKHLPGENGAALLAAIEEEMSQEAREAIDLLNAAALELHPEAEDYGGWSGPLEWVNQEWREYDGLTDMGRSRVVKKEILRIYDHAIEQRKTLALATS